MMGNTPCKRQLRMPISVLFIFFFLFFFQEVYTLDTWHSSHVQLYMQCHAIQAGYTLSFHSSSGNDEVIVLHEDVLPVQYPSAWWWHAWNESHTGLRARGSVRDTFLLLLAGRWVPLIEIEDPRHTLHGQLHEPTCKRATEIKMKSCSIESIHAESLEAFFCMTTGEWMKVSWLFLCILAASVTPCKSVRCSYLLTIVTVFFSTAKRQYRIYTWIYTCWVEWLEALFWPLKCGDSYIHACMSTFLSLLCILAT